MFRELKCQGWQVRRQVRQYSLPFGGHARIYTGSVNGLSRIQSIGTSRNSLKNGTFLST